MTWPCLTKSGLYSLAGSSQVVAEVVPWQLQVIVFQIGALCRKKAFPIVPPEKVLTVNGSQLVQLGSCAHP